MYFLLSWASVAGGVARGAKRLVYPYFYYQYLVLFATVWPPVYGMNPSGHCYKGEEKKCRNKKCRLTVLRHCSPILETQIEGFFSRNGTAVLKGFSLQHRSREAKPPTWPSREGMRADLLWSARCFRTHVQHDTDNTTTTTITGGHSW